METVVFFGGFFLVARSSSLEKCEVGVTLTLEEMIRRKSDVDVSANGSVRAILTNPSAATGEGAGAGVEAREKADNILEAKKLEADTAAAVA